MTRLLSISFILLVVLGHSAFGTNRVKPRDIVFEKREIPFYTFADFTPQATLKMGYASHEITNPDKWLALSKEHIPIEVDLVFTKYPEDIRRWRTDYNLLLRNRLKEILALDSAFTLPDVKWNMILQTHCRSEEEAKTFFHGFVVKYRPRVVRVIDEVKSTKDLHDMLEGSAVPKDSTVVKVVQRHPEWDEMLVVMDWTGSMYQYGAQLVLWHKHNLALDKSRVEHVVFFNDGNKKKTHQKKVGTTGGIYHTYADDLFEVVETMEQVMDSGNGGDIPENDFEAISKSTKLLSGYEDVILIADNASSVRDMSLLQKIDRPVHVILCGIKPDGYVNPDYVKLAYHTGGSIHTLGQDLVDLADLLPGEVIRIGNMDYMVKNGSLGQVARPR
ncbi:MAG: hypothetical protein AB8F95_17740 [Bacteroidia bacterium]